MNKNESIYGYAKSNLYPFFKIQFLSVKLVKSAQFTNCTKTEPILKNTQVNKNLCSVKINEKNQNNAHLFGISNLLNDTYTFLTLFISSTITFST